LRWRKRRLSNNKWRKVEEVKTVRGPTWRKRRLSEGSYMEEKKTVRV
jgi:hypothetical protein